MNGELQTLITQSGIAVKGVKFVTKNYYATVRIICGLRQVQFDIINIYNGSLDFMLIFKSHNADIIF